MAIGNITSANASFVIACEALAIAATRIEGYAPDSSVTVEQQEQTVSRMGVDGRLSVGWVPSPTVVTITLSADSPSNAPIRAIIAAQKTARNPLFLTGTLEHPSINTSYNFGRGTVSTSSQVASGGRVLETCTYTFTFEQCNDSII